jgi:hypothetical protein
LRAALGERSGLRAGDLRLDANRTHSCFSCEILEVAGIEQGAQEPFDGG